MEIIIQWLDDLEDLVFASIQSVERMRWPGLEVAFVAACALAALRVADPLADSMTSLLWIVAGGLSLWAVGSSMAALSRPAELDPGTLVS